MTEYKIYVDGACRGNNIKSIKRIARVGVLSEDLDATIRSTNIGDNTNNEAEYSAVIEALNFVVREIYHNLSRIKSEDTVHILTDSQLVIGQLRKYIPQCIITSGYVFAVNHNHLSIKVNTVINLVKFIQDKGVVVKFSKIKGIDNKAHAVAE